MISQMFLLAFSITGVWFSASKEHRSLRWSSVFGLCAQPFWFYQTFTHQQWGIFCLSFVFTALYVKGFYLYWILPARERRHRSLVREMIFETRRALINMEWRGPE